MIPAKILWKPILQKMVTDRWKRFRMTTASPSLPFNLKRAGLYLHVPFCKNLCPFCPYHRISYDPELFRIYENAIHQEIEWYTPYLRNCDIISLYIGGGTPTVHPEGLIRIIDHLHRNFSLTCDICIELHPENMDPESLSILRQARVNQLSIGVESASDSLLERIGRNHTGATALGSLRRAADAGFDSVNADLMFALPGQTLADWETDVQAVIDAGADQISTYPMFSFPYSELGKMKQLQSVERPDRRTIRAMLRMTDVLAEAAGFRQCAVWSWIKPSRKKFSSITRHHYIGFGPSAASMTGDFFYVNTFDIPSYAQSLPRDRPVALSLPLDRRLEMAYWLYWRMYELRISDSDFKQQFGEEASLDDMFSHIFKPLEQLGMVERNNGVYRVTRSGAYWIHRLQNEYSLNYINRLWGTCRSESWPAEVML